MEASSHMDVANCSDQKRMIINIPANTVAIMTFPETIKNPPVGIFLITLISGLEDGMWVFYPTG
jgi:hypothetical protein